jgi:hypothetical protein
MRPTCTAVQIEGGWHYASASSRGGHPLGYCAEHPPHASEQEARDCYGQWQRDHLRLDQGSWSWGGCDAKGCPNPANRAADIEGDGYQIAMLCPDHMTTEHAVAALHIAGAAGDAWRS